LQFTDPDAGTERYTDDTADGYANHTAADRFSGADDTTDLSDIGAYEGADASGADVDADSTTNVLQ